MTNGECGGQDYPHSSPGAGYMRLCSNRIAGSRSVLRSSGPSRSTNFARCATSRAGAMAREVASMHPTMISNPKSERRLLQRERLGQPAGLVELDVDGVIFATQPFQIPPAMRRFIGTQRHLARKPAQELRHRRRAAAARRARRRGRRTGRRVAGGSSAGQPSLASTMRRASGAARRTACSRSGSPGLPSLSLRSGRSGLSFRRRGHGAGGVEAQGVGGENGLRARQVPEAAMPASPKPSPRGPRARNRARWPPPWAGRDGGMSAGTRPRSISPRRSSRACRTPATVSP